MDGGSARAVLALSALLLLATLSPPAAGSDIVGLHQTLADGQRLKEIPVPTPDSHPWGLAAAPNGDVWFTELFADKIGVVHRFEVVAEYPLVGSHDYVSPRSITFGPDGAFWFTEGSAEAIGRITTEGAVTDYPLSPGAQPWDITVGPDSMLWFTDTGLSYVGQLTPDGELAKFPIPTPTTIFGITSGPDGALWFTEPDMNRIGRITTDGVVTAEYPVPTPNASPWDIARGQDGALWFTELSGGKIGRITTTGRITEYRVNGGPQEIAAANGCLWFVEPDYLNGKLGRITLDGRVDEFPIGTEPQTVAVDVDGLVWFGEQLANELGVVRPSTTSPAALLMPYPYPPAMARGPGDYSGAERAFTWAVALPLRAGLPRVGEVPGDPQPKSG